MDKTLGEIAREESCDPRVAEREHVATPMGEVCMSRTEAEAYREALEERELLRDAKGHDE